MWVAPRPLGVVCLILSVALVACEASPPETAGDESWTDAVARLSSDDTSFVVRAEGTFEQIGLFLVGGPERVSVRLLDGADWTEPVPVEITWREGALRVARLILPSGFDAVELVDGADYDEAQIQLYAQAVAQPHWPLARNLPVVSSASEAQGFRTTRQAMLPDWIVTREGWGARDPSRVCGDAHTPRYITIHHTVTPTSDSITPAARVRGIQAYHIDSNGWCDIGYHFLVGQDGRVYQGRSSEMRTGAHAGGANTNNVGVSFLGTFTADVPSDTMFSGGADVVRWIAQTYDVTLNREWLKGHREWGATACPGEQLYARLDRLIDEASRIDPDPDPDPTETYAADVDVRIVGISDRLAEGVSVAVPDVTPGELFFAELTLTNRSSTDLTGVELTYRVDVPFALARDYQVETDAPAHDRSSWQLDSADADPRNPPRDQFGGSGWLQLGTLVPGQSKRVVVTLEGGTPSLDSAAPTMVRAWLRRAEGVYDLHEQWDQNPVVDQIGRHVRDEARFDTLTPWAWDFEGDYGLEGWTACAEHPVRVEEGALVFATVGCADSPDWTAIDTDLFDQVVLQIRTDTAGEAELFWGQGPGSPTGGARFATLAGEQMIVLPVGLLTSWDSAIRWLRLRPGVGPAATRVGTTDLAALWVQHSATHLSTGPGFSSLQPVALLSGPELNPAADVGPSPAAEDDPDDQAPIRSSTLESSTGCATVSPVSPAWWLVVGFASLALRRRNRVASDF